MQRLLQRYFFENIKRMYLIDSYIVIKNQII